MISELLTIELGTSACGECLAVDVEQFALIRLALFGRHASDQTVGEVARRVTALDHLPVEQAGLSIADEHVSGMPIAVQDGVRRRAVSASTTVPANSFAGIAQLVRVPGCFDLRRGYLGMVRDRIGHISSHTILPATFEAGSVIEWQRVVRSPGLKLLASSAATQELTESVPEAAADISQADSASHLSAELPPEVS